MKTDPITLIDDFSAELGMESRRLLLKLKNSGCNQIFLTVRESEQLSSGIDLANLFHVEQERVL